MHRFLGLTPFCNKLNLCVCLAEIKCQIVENILYFIVNANYETESDLYEKLVRSMLESGNSDEISNGKPEHAAVIFKLFFEFATAKVLIFCKDLNSSVFGDDRILMAAVKAVERGVSIRVITQSAEVQKNKFSDWLSKMASEGTCVSFKKCLDSHHFVKLPANFAVMDEKAFRLEPNNQNIQAKACMNNPKLAKDLGSVFQVMDSAVA